MTNKDFLRKIQDKDSKKVLKLLGENLEYEFGLKFEDFSTLSKEELIEKYSISGALKKPRKGNHEINYLNKCKELFSIPTEEIESKGIYLAIDLVKESPAKQGVDFYHDAKAVLKGINKQDFKTLDNKESKVRREEKEKDGPGSRVTRLLEKVKDYAAAIVAADVMKDAAKSFLEGGQPLDQERVITIVALAGALSMPYVISKAREEGKQHAKVIADTLRNSTVRAIYRNWENQPDKHPCVKSEEAVKLKKEEIREASSLTHAANKFFEYNRER